ncbi:MAG TPA: amidohydrolase family protein [Candidatus Sulfotelmatobacter sp.]|nr:amidohydrolase family protein [Candidatus Sulfotelmatobacter sp.]
MQHPGIDLDALVAIDVHVHAHVHEEPNEVARAASRYFGHAEETPTDLDALAEYYRTRKIAAVVFAMDERLSGRAMVPNDAVLAAAARNSDILVPFASVDPMRGPAALTEVDRLIDAGARGFKLHPPLQGFFANDPAVYPFYERLEAARLPVLVHTGHSGIGTGVRGGAGVRLKYGNPLPLDDVAVDFPDLPIIMAHPSFPWQDEAISVCMHKPNVYIDLSGWSPKYFSPTLVQYAQTRLREKVLFGSDYPLLTPDRWLRDFAALPFRDEVRPLVLKENAARLLQLG